MAAQKRKKFNKVLISPEGKRVHIRHLGEFAKEAGMSYMSAKFLSTGRRTCIKGWISPRGTGYKETKKRREQKVINLVTGEIETLGNHSAFAEKHEMDQSSVSKLYTGTFITVKNWTTLEAYQLAHGK